MESDDGHDPRVSSEVMRAVPSLDIPHFYGVIAAACRDQSTSPADTADRRKRGGRRRMAMRGRGGGGRKDVSSRNTPRIVLRK